MAKRKSNRPTQQETFEKRRILLTRLVWLLVVGISVLFGYSFGYPLVAAGEVGRGILTGLAYGGGALLVIGVSLFLNRKLKGL